MKRAFLAILAAGLLGGAGCGGNAPPEAEENAAQPIDTSRCENVPASIRQGIKSSLDRGIRVRALSAVRSRPFENLWFVSGDLQGAGLEGDDDFAVWATNALERGGLVWTIEAVAEEFSDLGPAPGGSYVGEDGYSESVDCVRAEFSR